MEQEEKAFKQFDLLKIGQSLDVHNFASRDPDSFIIYAKNYIDKFQSLEFSNDYKIITKIETSQQAFDRLNSRLEIWKKN